MQELLVTISTTIMLYILATYYRWKIFIWLWDYGNLASRMCFFLHHWSVLKFLAGTLALRVVGVIYRIWLKASPLSGLLLPMFKSWSSSLILIMSELDMNGSVKVAIQDEKRTIMWHQNIKLGDNIKHHLKKKAALLLCGCYLKIAHCGCVCWWYIKS